MIIFSRVSAIKNCAFFFFRASARNFFFGVFFGCFLVFFFVVRALARNFFGVFSQLSQAKPGIPALLANLARCGRVYV